MAFGCTWLAPYLSWHCQVISIDERGHSAGSENLGINFLVPGDSAQTVSDLVNRSFKGEGNLAYHSGYSWTPHSALEIQVLSFDSKNRLVNGQFEGMIDRLTWRYPKGRLLGVNNGVFHAKLLWDDLPSGLPIVRRPPDPYRTVEGLKRLSKIGDLKAKYLLGHVYQSGRAVPQDKQTPLRLWQEAAEAGYPDAQSFYGITFANDKVAAYMWNYLAAKGGYEDARRLCRQIGSSMSRAQRDEAIRRADAWKPKKS